MQMTAYEASKQKRLHLLSILLLCFMTLAVYSNSFSSGFVQDNQKMILLDGRITAVKRANLALIFTRGYWFPIETSGLYRPVTTLSYLLNYAVLGNGARPAGYHAVNLALQGLNAALVYLLAFKLFGSTGLAFATAAIWSSHPLLTESVTNIIGRSDLLAGAAILGALIIHIRAFDGRAAAVLAIISSIGILCKEN